MKMAIFWLFLDNFCQNVKVTRVYRACSFCTKKWLKNSIFQESWAYILDLSGPCFTSEGSLTVGIWYICGYQDNIYRRHMHTCFLLYSDMTLAVWLIIAVSIVMSNIRGPQRSIGPYPEAISYIWVTLLIEDRVGGTDSTQYSSYLSKMTKKQLKMTKNGPRWHPYMVSICCILDSPLWVMCVIVHNMTCPRTVQNDTKTGQKTTKKQQKQTRKRQKTVIFMKMVIFSCPGPTDMSIDMKVIEGILVMGHATGGRQLWEMPYGHICPICVKMVIFGHFGHVWSLRTCLTTGWALFYRLHVMYSLL